MRSEKSGVLIAIGVLIICLAAFLCFSLTRKQEPVASAFLTKLYTVEDPAAAETLFAQMEEEIQKKMAKPRGEGIVTLPIGEDPLFAYYLKQYGALCTREGMEAMYANRFLSAFAMLAIRQKWSFRAGVPVLDRQTPNQLGYQLDVTVTDVATGQEKNVPQHGIVLLKRTLFGYKVQAIRMQSKLVNPQLELLF